MTFREIQDDVLDRLDYNPGATVQPLVRSRVQRTLNLWHRRLLSSPKLSRLRDRVTTFASVTTSAGVHVLPPSVARINRIYETTGNTRLTDRTLDWLRNNPNAANDTGTPQIYVPLGLQAILQVPASTGLWVASSSASDVTQKANVEAVRASLYPRTPVPVTLNGTTRVAIDSTITTFTDVLKFFVDGPCVGDVSLYDAAAAGNVLAVIPIGSNAAKYQGLYLYPTPAASLTYTLEYLARVPTMVQEHDEPMLPEDFHDVLCAAGRYEEFVIKQQYSTAQAVKLQELDPRIKELTAWLVNLPDTVIVPNSPSRPVFQTSNLGANFPAGSW